MKGTVTNMNVMDSNHLLKELYDDGIVAIIRGMADADLLPLAQALSRGGIRWAEITFDQSHPDSVQDTASAIARLRQHLGADMHIGAGTVLTVAQAKLALKAGAEFLISPNVNTDVIRYTVEAGALSMPGAMTPTEIVNAYEAGAHVVKVFPADSLGLPYLKALKAPLSHIPMMAVGGVNVDNAADFLRLGLFGVGVGSSLTPKALIREGNFDAITQLAARYVSAVRTVRSPAAI